MNAEHTGKISRNRQIRQTLAVVRQIGKAIGIGNQFGYSDAMRQHYRLKCSESAWSMLQADIRIKVLMVTGRITFDHTKDMVLRQDRFSKSLEPGHDACIRIWPKPGDDIDENITLVRKITEDDFDRVLGML